MKKLILGISTMISGILLTCAALIAGGSLGAGKNVYIGSGSWDIADFPTALAFIIVGGILAIIGFFIAYKNARKE